MTSQAATTEMPQARRFAPGLAADPAHSFEASRDRILITLLALNLMLMAFFVVLNSTATIDKSRSAEVAHALPANAAPVIVTDTPSAATAEAVAGGGAPRLEASELLRTAVADVFAGILPAGTGGATDAADGRVDVDVPATVAEAEALPAVLDGIARVMANPPAGYHTELLIRAPQAEPTQVAHLAQDLVARGVAATELSVGVAEKDANQTLRFTFLLLEPGEEPAARLLARPSRPISPRPLSPVGPS